MPPTATAHVEEIDANKVWDIARLFPDQGDWSEGEYLSLDTNRLVEYTDGNIEVLTMPTTAHQLIVAFLYGLVFSFVAPRKLGTVLFAPLRIRTRKRKFREPDVLFMFAENKQRMSNEYWERADLVMEVVSEGEKARKRDLKDKRADYAEADIPEYWIVDPETETITVLRLQDGSYVIHSEAQHSGNVASALLEGFVVDAAKVFAAAKA